MRVFSSVLALAAVASSMATLSSATPLGATGPSLEAETVFFPRAHTLAQAQPKTRSIVDSSQPSPLKRGTQSLSDLFGLTRRSRSKQRRRRVAVQDATAKQHARRAGTCSKKTSTTSSSTRVAPTTTSSSKTSTSAKSTSTSKTSTSTSKASTSTAKTSTSTSKASTSTTIAAKATTTTAKATSTTSAAKSTATASSLLMGGYWPSWVNDELPPSKIDWTLYDYMCFAFATPNSDGSINLGDWEASLLKTLVTAGHNANKKVLLSIGGWGGSSGFSPSVASDSMRATFVKSIRAVVDKYSLDGVDLDWEYPNSEFAGTYSSADTANFQTFLGSLRSGLPTGSMITAAVSQSPWIASTGSPVGSVARAASALDYILIMNYDVWGASSTPGPNAPLADLCGNSTQSGASAAAAVKQWSAAGMPRSKMILGSPLYGYVSTSSKTTLKQRSLGESSQPVGLYDALSARAPARRSAYERSLAASEHYSKRAITQADGQINFDLIVSGGALTLSGSEYVASGGYTKYWDDCSDTPYLANGKKVITYDDTDSLYDKGSFVAQAGLGGSGVWSVDGDVSSWALTKSLRSGMGL